MACLAAPRAIPWRPRVKFEVGNWKWELKLKESADPRSGRGPAVSRECGARGEVAASGGCHPHPGKPSCQHSRITTRKIRPRYAASGARCEAGVRGDGSGAYATTVQPCWRSCIAIAACR